MRVLCDVVNRRESVGVSKMSALHQQAQEARPVPHRPINDLAATNHETSLNQAPLVPQTRQTHKPHHSPLYPLPLSPKRPTNQPSTLSRNPPPDPLRPHPNIRTQI